MIDKDKIEQFEQGLFEPTEENDILELAKHFIEMFFHNAQSLEKKVFHKYYAVAKLEPARHLFTWI